MVSFWVPNIIRHLIMVLRGGCSQALSHESHATVATVGAQVQNSKREMSRLFLRVPKGV